MRWRELISGMESTETKKGVRENNINLEIVLHDQSDRRRTLVLTDEELSKHILMVGEHGSGKTNVFCHLLEQIDTGGDKIIIFDPKEDYVKRFYRDGKDLIIGNSMQFREQTMYWNIFREIEFSDRYMDGKKLTLKELVNSFFEGRENTSQPFFSNAAKDLFAMVIECQMDKLWGDSRYQAEQRKIDQDLDRERNSALEKQRYLFEELVDKELNNARLAEIVRDGSLESYREMLGGKFPKVYSYFGKKGEYHTGLSVIGEMQAMFYELFQYTLFDKFQRGRDIAICDYINSGNGRLFIEYSISTAAALGPIYKSLIDMTLKMQMSNYKMFRNRCYLFLDELKLVPRLVHLENGLNFGRALGVRIVAGIQSIEQLQEVYGEDTASVLLNGFSTLFCFKLTGAADSRDYVVKRIGQRGILCGRDPKKGDLTIVDEESILQLDCGQAICKKTGKLYPFLFYFEKYKDNKPDLDNLLDNAFRNMGYT